MKAVRVVSARGVRAVRAALAALAAVAGVACNVEVGIDRATWACVTNADCGQGARCVFGACVPEPIASRCFTRTRSGVSARFEVDAERMLIVDVGGREVRYALPARVVRVEDGPIAGCCENTCCSERP